MNLPDFVTRIHNVLVISSNPDAHSELEGILSLSSNYHTTVIFVDTASVYKPAVLPEVIIADLHQLTDSQYNALLQLRTRFREIPLILITADLSDNQIRLLLKLSVTDWMKRPLNLKHFHQTLQGCLNTGRGSTGSVHAVISAVGGAGATTVAISISDILSRPAKKGGKRVALFDLDFSSGNCGYALNSVTNHNLDAAIQMPSRIDAQFIDIIKTRYDNRLNIFSFRRPDVLYEPNGPEMVLRMLDAVCLAHDHTVIDIPYYYTPWRDQVLGSVNTITLVSQLNLPAVKHTRDLALEIREAAGEAPNIRIVFNKQRRRLFGQTLKMKNIKEFFKRVQMYELSDDHATLEEALNRGRLPSEINARSRFVREIEKHVKDFILAEAQVA